MEPKGWMHLAVSMDTRHKEGDAYVKEQKEPS
jgi:hypothetical protein